MGPIRTENLSGEIGLYVKIKMKKGTEMDQASVRLTRTSLGDFRG